MKRGLAYGIIDLKRNFKNTSGSLVYKPTLFSQLLKHLPHDVVKKASEKFDSDKYTKSFKTSHHLKAMLYFHLGGFDSLRSLENTYKKQSWAHYHLANMQVRRSTLSDANRTRDSEVFAYICQEMICHLPQQQRQELSSQLKILDASPIKLKGRGHQWAEAASTRRCQGLKVHLGMNYEGADIWFAAVSDANVNDITIAQNLKIESHQVYVFDKGYCDYNWWHHIHKHQAYFVTRLKKNAAYDVIEERLLAPNSGVIRDRVIVLTNKTPRSKHQNLLAGIKLRLIEVPHPSKKSEVLTIVSNILDREADVVAGMYKKRWTIELLFKFLKQNVKLKKFIGESKNAILIQIYTALIAYILALLFHCLKNNGKTTLKETLLFIKHFAMHWVEMIGCSPPNSKSNSLSQLSFNLG